MLVLVGCIGVGLNAIIEYNTATLFFKQQNHQLATEYLLDHATAGYCRIEVATGIVTAASSKLEQTLIGNGRLQGVGFATLLCSAEDKRALSNLLDDTAAHVELAPILVSFQSPGPRQFDAKVIPYSTSARHLSVCVQIIGEIREAVDLEGDAKDPTDDEATHEILIQNCEDDSGSVAHSEGTVSLAYTQTTDPFDGIAYSRKSGETAVIPHGEALPQIAEIEMVSVGTQTLIAQPLPSRAGRNKKQRNSFQAPVRLKTRKLIYSTFEETPKLTINQLIIQTIVQINPRGKGCCYYHIGLDVLLQHISFMKLSECKPRCMPFSGWQCKKCGIVLEDEDAFEERVLMCPLCLSDRPDTMEEVWPTPVGEECSSFSVGAESSCSPTGPESPCSATKTDC